jgi:hypothetical protein
MRQPHFPSNKNIRKTIHTFLGLEWAWLIMQIGLRRIHVLYNQGRPHLRGNFKFQAFPVITVFLAPELYSSSAIILCSINEQPREPVYTPWHHSNREPDRRKHGNNRRTSGSSRPAICGADPRCCGLTREINATRGQWKLGIVLQIQ